MELQTAKEDPCIQLASMHPKVKAERTESLEMLGWTRAMAAFSQLSLEQWQEGPQKAAKAEFLLVHPGAEFV